MSFPPCGRGGHTRNRQTDNQCYCQMVVPKHSLPRYKKKTMFNLRLSTSVGVLQQKAAKILSIKWLSTFENNSVAIQL